MPGPKRYISERDNTSVNSGDISPYFKAQKGSNEVNDRLAAGARNAIVNRNWWNPGPIKTFNDTYENIYGSTPSNEDLWSIMNRKGLSKKMKTGMLHDLGGSDYRDLLDLKDETKHNANFDYTDTDISGYFNSTQKLASGGSSGLSNALQSGQVDAQGRPIGVRSNIYSPSLQTNSLSNSASFAEQADGSIARMRQTGSQNRVQQQLANIPNPEIGAPNTTSWAGRNAGTIGTAAVSGATTYAATGDVSKAVEGAAASIPVYGQIAGLAFAGRDLTKQGLDSGLLSPGKNEYGDYSNNLEQGMNAGLTTVHENVINKIGDGDWLGAGQSLINPAGDILNGLFGKRDTSGEDAYKKKLLEENRMNLENTKRQRANNNPYLAGRAIVNKDVPMAKDGGRMKSKYMY